MKLLIGSDIHLGSIYHNDKAFHKFLELAASSKYDVVGFLGDTIDIGTKGSMRFEQNMPPEQAADYFRASMEEYQLNDKIDFLVEGNHDRRSYVEAGYHLLKDWCNDNFIIYTSSLLHYHFKNKDILLSHTVGNGRDFSPYRRLAIQHNYDAIVLGHTHETYIKPVPRTSIFGNYMAYWIRCGCMKNTSDWERERGWLCTKACIEISVIKNKLEAKIIDLS